MRRDGGGECKATRLSAALGRSNGTCIAPLELRERASKRGVPLLWEGALWSTERRGTNNLRVTTAEHCRPMHTFVVGVTMGNDGSGYSCAEKYFKKYD